MVHLQYLHPQICEGRNVLKYSLRQGGEVGVAQDQPRQVPQILEHSFTQGEGVVVPEVTCCWVLREHDERSRAEGTSCQKDFLATDQRSLRCKDGVRILRQAKHLVVRELQLELSRGAKSTR